MIPETGEFKWKRQFKITVAMIKISLLPQISLYIYWLDNKNLLCSNW